jgi:5-methylcytosine-specific restriction endonuclease McrA
MKIKDNLRITPKERGLLKGAARRVFSRSELRKLALAAVSIIHADPERPRVKKWGQCPECTKLVPLYLFQVDHVSPIVPLDTPLEDMSWDSLINNIWCNPENLRAICITCHKTKTKAEAKERAKLRKERKSK